jgi:GH24 family phage-related lysozyme (muramidase)
MNQQNVADRLYRFEGSIPHMYRCTGGEVTIGVGHAIQTAADACGLSWDITASDVIEGDYRRVAAAEKGQYAGKYAGLSTCRMNGADIDSLLQQDIATFTVQLRQALPNFDSYPEPVQEALFDMAYNLGIAGLMKFSTMLAAVEAGNWETAAQESHRKGIPEDRNEETAGLFRSSERSVTGDT